jgi:hypothetical protein
LYARDVKKYSYSKIELDPLQIQLISDFHSKFVFDCIDSESIGTAVLADLSKHDNIFEALDYANLLLINTKRFGSIKAAMNIIKAIEERI